MRKGKPSKKKPPPSRLTREQKARFVEIASEYGVEAPKPGSQLDRKYNQDTKEEPTRTLYQSLAASIGVSTLEALEKGLYVTLGSLLLFIIGGGLAISSEAFFKASGKPVPEGFDVFATWIGGTFTPVLLLFLVLSSILGLYKQSQLSSGASSYTELGSERKNK